jgi:hypothetical protein
VWVVEAHCGEDHLGTLRVTELDQVRAPEPVDDLYLYDVELEMPNAVVHKQVTHYRRHGWRRLIYKAMAAVI